METCSKLEYLKRYLPDGNADNKKKKKKKHPLTLTRSKIIDDDVDFKTLLPSNLENTLEEDVGDNDPMVADFVDERPDNVKEMEQFRGSNKWNMIGSGHADDSTDSDDDRPNRTSVQRKRHDSDDSPRRQRHDSDVSPPRRQRHDSDQSPPRKQNKKHDMGKSPPRKRVKGHDSDQSPPTRQRRDSDQSPPRKQIKRKDSDQSPPRRQRHDSDQSPPRRQRHDSDQSPPRRQRHDSDQSPSRRQRHDSDQSPLRKSKHNNDNSPAGKNKSRDVAKSNSNGSLGRTSKQNINKDKHSDKSRKKKSRFEPDSPTRSVDGRDFSRNDKLDPLDRRKNSADRGGKMSKTLSGATAGLSSAREMRHEMEMMKKRQDDAFKKIDDTTLGKNVSTVFRDKKSGRQRDFHEERRQQREEEKKKQAQDAKFAEMAKGKKQQEQQGQLLTEALHEASKPFARYRDDADFDQMMREQDRQGDPMLTFLSKKKSTTKGNTVKEKPKYKGRAGPPNRFNIIPGYRWDGVDRSNGFEKKMFEKQADRKATKELAFKWSTEDM